MENLQTEITKLVAANKFDEAINRLIKEAAQTYQQELINESLLLTSSFDSLESDIISGTLTKEAINVEKQKINKRILLLTDKIIRAIEDDRIEITKNAAGHLRNMVGQIKINKGILATNTNFGIELKLIFDQIENSYKIVLDSINKYLTPAFDGSVFSAANYVELTNGTLGVEIDKKRGHCHLISNQYHKTNGIKDSLMKLSSNNEDLGDLDFMFVQLSDSDHNIFEQIGAIGNFIEEGAAKVMDLFIAGNHEEAKNKIFQDSVKLRPLKKQMLTSIKELHALGREFGHN